MVCVWRGGKCGQDIYDDHYLLPKLSVSNFKGGLTIFYF